MSGQVCAGQVLVIRPPRPGDPLLEGLRDAGFSVISLPVMKIENLTENAHLTENRIRNLKDYQKAVFVSTNAATQGAAWINRCWKRLPAGLELFAVGATTAATLVDNLNYEERPQVWFPESELNTRGLLALTQFEHIAGQRILIFRGQGGRETMRDQLQSRGAMVDYCELYRRTVDATHSQELDLLLAAGGPDFVIAHSGELVQFLLSVVSDQYRPWLYRKPLLVPGTRVAAIARQQGFYRLISAASALAGDMVEALRHWYTAAQQNSF